MSSHSQPQPKANMAAKERTVDLAERLETAVVERVGSRRTRVRVRANACRVVDDVLTCNRSE